LNPALGDKLHLFTNDATPLEATVLAGLTECDVAGYAATTLSAPTVATVGDVTTATYSQQTFTFTAATTVYGYYLTDNGGTKLLWAERFTDGPYRIPSGGGEIKVTPKIAVD
jgi:hypothetical protein